jgi:hypothetical protein
MVDTFTQLHDTSVLIELTINRINELKLKIKNAQPDTDVAALASQMESLEDELYRLDQKYLDLTGLFD